MQLSVFPAEIWQKIIAHNSDDVPSLRALCLVSEMTRSWAIEQLFSVVHYSCAEDISWWNTMVGRTPRLQTVVRMVRFSQDPSTSRARHPTELHGAVVPSRMLTMPNVRIVEWDVTSSNISIAVQHLILFPNMKEFRLTNIELNDSDDAAQLLGACGRLRVLSVRSETLFGNTQGEEVHPKTGSSAGTGVPQLDLTALEELTFIDCSPEEIFLYELMEKSRPFHLKSLTFSGEEDPYPVLEMEKLLQLAAPSLIHLVVDPSFNDSVVQMFSRLPPFPTLDTLSVAFDANHQAAKVMNVLGPAPHLTALILRISLPYNHLHLLQILRAAFPWCSSESMKSTLTRRFPLLRRISFHFFAPRNSAIHFRRGLRRWMERQLRKRLEETEIGEDVAEYLEVKWFDDADKLHPVTYSKINGKPPWNRDTEVSDYESDSWNRDEPDAEGSDYGSDM
ncbi:hypothetical protein C8F04DRAFT_694495 [Mycena alexandri]|uniref:Uncharacterized protein n=1 Tax=Mycena alexandri TaxID=1745969 RepID=A0AAD6WY23_9AGAR|nr:hypothetical protein C8F04DRAFT_694495 [Mycena alexandri]